jgi:putative membrane protein
MREPAWLALAVVAVGVLLGVAPVADRFTWLLENLPVLVGLPVLVATWRRWPLTPLLYRLLAVHAVILMVGGHWTYAAVPAGDWLRDGLDLARNPYDRLGHFAQGFVPAILVRELCLRRGLDVRGWFGAMLVVFVCLGFSALYELFEWQAAVWTGAAATDFLGTQGDPWDTQWDMACCGLGAALSLASLSRRHDRQLGAMRG